MTCLASRSPFRVVNVVLALVLVFPALSRAESPRSVSGIYPHLAMFNNEGECGTGAVVPWADRLWIVTYAPHMPQRSSDKLYELTPRLEQIVRPESVGGTPANRMIHRETEQLVIGPYVIDKAGQVRVIPYKTMFGRPTGCARHLTEPEKKIYIASMEEALYEVDLATLDVKELWTDEQRTGARHAKLPGYHGKGLYSGQGRIIYANNGEHGNEALQNPRTPSGVLASWDGQADAWTVVRRNQFTEVTGPGGIRGNEHPATDPIWSIGWDDQSLLLMVLHEGKWHTYRLPKASHSYDGAHGWNTEWPRIRDIGEQDLLMTMHGMFWRFPRDFTPTTPRGIRPRSAYLKVIGDFCQWQDRLVFGCDDTAKSEFLNKRQVKGGIEGPGQSHSNLWFVEPEKLDAIGPTQASAAFWIRKSVSAGDVSDPLLFAGWEHRSLHLVNEGDQPCRVELWVDLDGAGEWTKNDTITIAAGKTVRCDFLGKQGEWLKIKMLDNCSRFTAHVAYSSGQFASKEPSEIFAGLATLNEPRQAGLVRVRGDNKRTLQYLAQEPRDGKWADIGNYEIDGELKFHALGDQASADYIKAKVAIPKNVVTVEESSVLVVDGRGRRWRFPKTNPAYDQPTKNGELRICREVSTERDLLSLHGTFYELPAENADGFAKVRPISTHSFAITDYCSYRGLLVMTGAKPNAPAHANLIRPEQGPGALWVGAIDDLWKLGKPRGTGGPWAKTTVKANQPSDPYLFWGYDQRRVTVSHNATHDVTFTVEADLTGEGLWIKHTEFDCPAGKPREYKFPAPFQARWLRFTTNHDCEATVQLNYE